MAEIQSIKNLDHALDCYCQAAESMRAAHRRSGKREWMLYTAAAGSALAAAQAADAAVIYSGVQNVMVTRTTTTGGTGAYLNLDGDALNDFAIVMNYDFVHAYAFLFGTLTGNPYVNVFLPDSNGFVRRLSSSFSMGSGAGGGNNLGLIRGNTSGGDSAGWPGGHPAGTSGFAGVGFHDASGDFHYGWIRLNVQNDANGIPEKITAVDWAYESTPDATIHVGSVPEPSSLALLAAGAAGVTAFRRRRD